MKHAFLVACWATFASLSHVADASAGIWEWGCMGVSGSEQIVFNRGNLIVAPAKPPLGRLDDLMRTDDLTNKFSDATGYNADDDNDGFQKTMTFTSQDDSKTLILTERSSTRISHKKHMVCGRDEITDIYRKVYRFDPPHASAHNITLQCMEYLLTTTGGRPCISN
jgi:hypothetical protein